MQGRVLKEWQVNKEVQRQQSMLILMACPAGTTG